MGKAAKQANTSLKKHALSFPEAWEDHPWGGTVVKVRKKIFCSLGPGPDSQDAVCMSVKLPTSEVQALDLEGAEPAGYGLGKHGWVTLRLDPENMPDIEILMGYIDESYRAIAPKALVKLLDA